jgi:hypothetical protein
LEKSKQFAEAVRRVAKDKKTPLIDYHAEILKRRPDDWDGALPKFKDINGSEYEAPTLISRDGVHPSYPKAYQDYSKESLRSNGYALRSYLTLLSYAEVIRQVVPSKPRRRGWIKAQEMRPMHFPHRIWAACDFEGRTPDYAWFGPPRRRTSRAIPATSPRWAQTPSPTASSAPS